MIRAKTQEIDRRGYSFIRNQFAQTGEMPSLREISKELGYKSPRSAQLLLERLRNEGLIYYIGGQIGLVHNPATSGGEHTVSVPVVGTAACGALTLADQVVEDYIELSTKIASPPYKYFILRAKGDSMNLSGIRDGDLVLVRQQPRANNGDKVVALVNDEATIKLFYLENGVVVLKPDSTDKSFRPIVLSEHLVIQGVVVQTIPNLY